MSKFVRQNFQSNKFQFIYSFIRLWSNLYLLDIQIFH